MKTILILGVAAGMLSTLPAAEKSMQTYEICQKKMDRGPHNPFDNYNESERKRLAEEKRRREEEQRKKQNQPKQKVHIPFVPPPHPKPKDK